MSLKIIFLKLLPHLPGDNELSFKDMKEWYTVETLYSTIYYSKYFIELNMISLHNKLPFELTKDTPYLALSGELWSVFYEYFNRNWSCYKGFLL